MRFFARLVLALTIFLLMPARADELRPGYLELRETASSTYEMTFKVPAQGEGLRLGIYVRLPGDVRDVVPRRAQFIGGAFVERRTFQRTGGLAGAVIAIDGLSATSTDVLVRIESLAGTTQTERLSPTRTELVVQAAPSAGEVAKTYFVLGVEHILTGFDHLFFVLALVLLVRTWRRVALTVTAFTIAHSITLAGATLGLVNVPSPPVEASIALSIVLVATEIVHARRGRPSLTARWPWLVAFGFGLLHGFGFAGALAEVGLPKHAIPVALLFFNLGVEIGQLAFVAVVLALIATIARLASSRYEPRRVAGLMDGLDIGTAYAIGSIAAFWLIARTAAFFA